MFTIEFLWWAGRWWVFHSHFCVQPNYSVKVVLCCCWGCDNNKNNCCYHKVSHNRCYAKAGHIGILLKILPPNPSKYSIVDGNEVDGLCVIWGDWDLLLLQDSLVSNVGRCIENNESKKAS